MPPLKFTLIILFFLFFHPDEMEALTCWNCLDLKCENPEQEQCVNSNSKCFSSYINYEVEKGCTTKVTTCPPGVSEKECRTCETDLCNDEKYEIVDTFRCYNCHKNDCEETIRCAKGKEVCVTLRRRGKYFKGCSPTETACKSLPSGRKSAHPCETCGTDLCNHYKELQPLKCWKCNDEKCQNPKEQECGSPGKVGHRCYTGYTNFLVTKGCAPGTAYCPAELSEDECDYCDSNFCNNHTHLIAEPYSILRCHSCPRGPCKHPLTLRCPSKTHICYKIKHNNYIEEKGCIRREKACLDDDNEKIPSCSICDEHFCNGGDYSFPNDLWMLTLLTLLLR